MDTLNLYGVEVQAVDYCRIKDLADRIFLYTLTDSAEKEARKASVYKAAALDPELKAWAKTIPAKKIRVRK